MYIKQSYFEFGDKPHTLLARQLRKRVCERAIHTIRSNSGSLVISHEEINNTFRHFYKDLYSSKCSAPREIMTNFLNHCKLPTLPQTDRMLMDAELTQSELGDAIRSLSNGKSPGPDGLCNEFYKKFSNLLTPYLLKMFNRALEKGKMPQTLNEATVTLIPKKGKDLEQVGSYRPISLLNSDQKILAKSLAKRLSIHMVKLVHPDQTGFIPTRHSSHNLRRLFNIIYSTRYPNEDLFILSLDAEKAFDCIEWPYLYAVLEKFGIGSKFISWVQLLYRNPCARILTNRTLSEPINLFRGTRQGCVLSPLLFALALEPLAETIRKDVNIRGYNTRYSSNKLSLYTDDILMYITELSDSVPRVLETINLFSSFTGYRINWGKSELMPIKCGDPNVLNHMPFKIATEKITYLGIEITKTYKSLYAANFTKILEAFKNKVEFWKSLPLSLIGRVNSNKMVCLPQLLYLFQNIPVYLSLSFFKKIDSILLPFIWNYKSHRIKKNHLCKTKKYGGLALPEFKYYYLATNIQYIAHWLDYTAIVGSWLEIEREDCIPYALGAIAISPICLKKSSYNHNPVIHNTVRVWRQTVKEFKLRALSFATPIAANPSFTPSVIDGTFDRWKEMGLQNVGHLYVQGNFASFQQLKEKYSLGANDFFRYLQIRNCVRSHIQSFETATPDKLDQCLMDCVTGKNTVSFIYETLLSLSQINMGNIKSAWEKELGVEIDDNIWTKGLCYVHSCSINTRHCLIQFKILHRLHYSKTRLHKIFPDVSPTCDKCECEEANLLHSFVMCNKLQSFWTSLCFSHVFLRYS